MENQIELHFVLCFRHKETGATYADACCKTIQEAHKTIRFNKRRGWELEKTGIEAIKHTGLFEHEQLAYQQI